MRSESDLNRVHLLGCANSFNSQDGCAIRDAAHLGDTRQSEFAIYNDRTCPAMAVCTGDFRPGKQHLPAQYVCKTAFRINNQGLIDPINDQ